MTDEQKQAARDGFVDGICTRMDIEKLTRAEVTAIVLRDIHATFVQKTIPELTLMISEMPAGVERDNAQLFVTIAGEFATAMARDLDDIMEPRRVIIAATDAHLKRILGGKS